MKYLNVGFRMLFYLSLYVFLIKDKTFDCGNQNIHTLNIITTAHNCNLQATLQI